MALRNMTIGGVIVGGGPIASLLVLRTQDGSDEIKLPIRIGTIEASAISLGVRDAAEGRAEDARPMTHDLLKQTIEALGARCASVRITKVEGTTFYAQLELVGPDGRTVFVDARPSDAVALAVRADVPVLAADSVIQTASLPDFAGVEEAEREAELAEFHTFVEGLTPDDFSMPQKGREE